MNDSNETEQAQEVVVGKEVNKTTRFVSSEETLLGLIFSRSEFTLGLFIARRDDGLTARRWSVFHPGFASKKANKCDVEAVVWRA